LLVPFKKKTFSTGTIEKKNSTRATEKEDF
jgi:hypothetical protein